ncbi:hypothetical protein J7K74_03725 [Candidatus Woesearchaeota archaeon]|nr:hypothetical protein [Candidatus Woesearchaeota archaeon]
MATPEPKPSPEKKEIEVEIVDVRIIPSADPRRLGKFDAIITIRLPNGAMHILRIPEECLKDEECLKEEIRKYFARISPYMGKRLKLTL